MKVERMTSETGTIRNRVFLKQAELTETDGAYTINDTETAAALADNSVIIVTDKPGTTMYWDKTDGVARMWTTGAYTALDVSEIGM